MSAFQLPILGLELSPFLGYCLSLIALWFILGHIYPLFRMLQTFRTPISLQDRYGAGSWAVVTGASFGIGAEFCEQLAALGYNIVLVARNGGVMKALAERIGEKYGVHTRVIRWDFERRERGVEELAGELEDLDVGILVNNVGVAADGLLVDHSGEMITRILDVNIWPIVFLTRWALSRMQKRKSHSAIINLSSAAASYPYAGMSVYSATKKFDDFLSISVRNEVNVDEGLQGKVDVLSVRPSYVRTGLIANFKKKPEAGVVVEPEECVQGALRSLPISPYTAGAIKHSLLTAFVSLLPERIKTRVFLAKLRAHSLSS